MKKQAIYLSKEGIVSGPFTAGQVEELRQSGDLYQYNLIWYNSITGWTPLEEEVDLVDSVSPPPLIPPVEELAFSQIDVICMDKKNVISGKIQNVSASGCELYSDVPVRLLPTFRVGYVVSLNLLNSLSGISENTPATIHSATQGQENWQYSLKWDLLPSLLNPKSKSV